MKTLFEEIVERGIPYKNHESDLYIPATEETTDLINRYYRSNVKLSGCVSFFTNRVEGGLWYDIAFAYQPFWEGKRG